MNERQKYITLEYYNTKTTCHFRPTMMINPLYVYGCHCISSAAKTNSCLSSNEVHTNRISFPSESKSKYAIH